ncbi:MAG: DNA polymerase III subunit alpha [Bacteroidota bacterium]|nr:DNA polymerase III subunit alpha [Bacteroidota bacterium]
MLLNCHTYYSFCYGTLSIDELLSEVKSNGYTEFVLSDINNTSACLETIRRCSEQGIRPVIGIDFRNGVQQQYVGIAKNNDGFKELNEHLTKHLHNEIAFETSAPEFENAYIIYPFSSYKGWALRENEFIGVSIKDIATYQFLSSKYSEQKFVTLQSVSFLNKRHHNAHRLLRAIDENVLLSMLPPDKQATLNEILISKKELQEAFSSYPHIIKNTEKIISNCSIHFEYGKFANKNLKFYTTSLAEDMALLRSECEKGIEYRYGNKPRDEVLQRIEKELQIIEQMNFASYFLINWDIIKYAQSRDYYYVGRGSGSNSILAYLLRITDVDPIELDLYFERFINPHRANPPDFDIDFSWTDRDDITRYIFERFGKDGKAALVGAYNTFQNDAVVRELGKVFGLPPGEIDKLQSPHKYPDIDELGKQVLRYSELIKGFPRHVSIHASGILISQEPITTYCATNMPPKGYPTTQFSMLEAEDIGLYKFDILSQRGLGKIKDSLALIKENRGVEIDIHQVGQFKEDKKVKDLLRVGNTIGCFYVESPAMRMLLAKLKADDYLRLVAASSIIRPGVSKSGMMREYIVRFRNNELREKARAQLPEFYDLLHETYGVMVYQEDVIKVAHFFAGLSLAEADYLRRGMSWKFKQRNEFFKVRTNFFDNCEKKGHDKNFIEGIWNQIESFANFAFSKGHSASYAVESYQALYLKAYFPLEYMTATLNNGGGFYRTELYIHEARMNGAKIEAPCINTSEALCVIKDKTIYLGLSMLNELERETVYLVIEERNRNGKFKDTKDFIKRVPISIEQMRILVRIGGFGFTGKNKKELLWEIHTLISPIKRKESKNELFEVTHKEWKLPVLTTNKLDEAFDEMELLGFSLCSPFELLRDKIPATLTARELIRHSNQTITIVGYLVNVKNTQTGKGDRMCFGTFIDLEGRWIDTVHFPPSARQYPFIGPGCYILTGKVVTEYDFTTVEVESMKRLAVVDREV